MRRLFVNGENRPRAGWRLLFQFLLNNAGGLLLGSLVLVAFGGLSAGGTGPLSSLYLNVLLYAATALAAVASVWIAGRFLDRRPFSGFGLRLNRAWWSDLGFGLILGASLMAAIFAVEFAAGWVTVTGSFEPVDGGTFFPAILAPVALFVCVGFYEELVSRGYQLTNLAEGLDTPGIGPRGAILLAWVLSSSFFGILHAFNPNTTPLSTINIALAGLMLGLGFVLTGELAIPIGLHITWNFFQGNVFGFPVSGLDPVGATFLTTDQTGPDLLTGGPFGPEGGLLAPAAMLAGCLLIALRVRRRSGNLTPHTPIAENPTRDRQTNR
ncbi:CPBP family intramembrane metalloprotease [Rubrobacter tropicus]|uniref:CPBP family intramembrane metalloprotease n=1 Tax=Rubrobacter tropicus TaxID=2653851 RepID=A0A6G8QF41_9ACTN|nr:CPBP family intramembrane glutamic endopeptidase [Rubrobacter tropicus]QIN84857.1 CPBP family intramembrane metalloprotease [Rubrobacter tropicus]